MATAHSEPISPARRRGPEHLFAALVLAFGLVFRFRPAALPGADELAHFFRAYQVSEGRLVPQLVVHKGGGQVPVSLLHVLEPFRDLPLHPNQLTSLGRLAPLWSVPLHPHQRWRRSLRQRHVLQLRALCSAGPRHRRGR